jgi:hypothetical protein
MIARENLIQCEKMIRAIRSIDNIQMKGTIKIANT